MGPGGSHLTLGMAFTFPARSPQLSFTTNSVYLKGRATIQKHLPPLSLPELEDTTVKCRPLLAPHVVDTRQPPAEVTPSVLPRGGHPNKVTKSKAKPGTQNQFSGPKS